MMVRLWAGLTRWWSGTPGGAEDLGNLLIFSPGRPPGPERLKAFVGRHRHAIVRWAFSAVGAGLIGWAVVASMKAITGLG